MVIRDKNFWWWHINTSNVLFWTLSVITFYVKHRPGFFISIFIISRTVFQIQTRRLKMSRKHNNCFNFMELSLLVKPQVFQLLKYFPFYGSHRFISEFTRTIHWSLSPARSIQTIPLQTLSLSLSSRYVLVHIIPPHMFRSS